MTTISKQTVFSSLIRLLLKNSNFLTFFKTNFWNLSLTLIGYRKTSTFFFPNSFLPSFTSLSLRPPFSSSFFHLQAQEFAHLCLEFLMSRLSISTWWCLLCLFLRLCSSMPLSTTHTGVPGRRKSRNGRVAMANQGLIMMLVAAVYHLVGKWKATQKECIW